jgi:hypothetical protein
VALAERTEELIDVRVCSRAGTEPREGVAAADRACKQGQK